ncbi:MAG: hypothetical protein ACOC9P_02300 [bacterium]
MARSEKEPTTDKSNKNNQTADSTPVFPERMPYDVAPQKLCRALHTLRGELTSDEHHLDGGWIPFSGPGGTSFTLMPDATGYWSIQPDEPESFDVDPDDEAATQALGLFLARLSELCYVLNMLLCSASEIVEQEEQAAEAAKTAGSKSQASAKPQTASKAPATTHPTTTSSSASSTS